MKKIVLITLLLLMSVHSFGQVEETVIEATEEEVEEVVIESRESPQNINSYYSNNTADIVTGEIDNTLLIFKGKNSSLYGLKNKNNEVLVKPIFKSISSYQSTKNRIKASLDWGKNGVIDAKGNVIIPFEYSDIYIRKDLFIATKNYKKTVFDRFGKKVFDKDYEEIDIQYNSNYIKVKENGFYGMIKPNGEEIFPSEYDNIYYYSGPQWFLLTQNGKSKFTDISGKSIFGNQYASEATLGYGFKFILVEKNGKKGLINKENQIIIPLKFQEIDKNYDYNFFMVKENDKWGVYDAVSDAFVIKPLYEVIKKISSNLYLVSQGDKKIFKDLLTGQNFDFSTYDNVKGYINYNIITIEKNGFQGGIDATSGKLIIPAKYKYLDINSNYISATLQDTRLKDIYDRNGDLLLANCSNITYLQENFYRVSSNGKVGILSRNKIAIPVEYDFIGYFKDHPFLLVKKGDKYGLINAADDSFLIPLGKSKISIDEENSYIFHNNKKYIISLGKLVEVK